MAEHKINLQQKSLVGFFSKDIEPILFIESGDSVQCQVLDAGWGWDSNGDREKLFDRPPN